MERAGQIWTINDVKEPGTVRHRYANALSRSDDLAVVRLKPALMLAISWAIFVLCLFRQGTGPAGYPCLANPGSGCFVCENRP